MKLQRFLSFLFFIVLFSAQQAAIGQTNWYKQTPDVKGRSANDNEGITVSISANGNAFATASALGSLQGKVRIYHKPGSTWVQKGDSLVGDNTSDFFGRSVSLDSTGNTIAIGAPYNDAGYGSFSNAGHVKIYHWVSGAWVQKGVTILADSAGINFGYSVSLSSDGNTVAVGAPFGAASNGRVKIYRWVSGAWTQLGVNLNGLNFLDNFGTSVSLSNSGNTLAVGTPFAGGGNGQVTLYAWNGTAWNQLGAAINGSVSDYLGTSVSLSSNGNRVAIGSPQDIFLGGFGSARVYEWNSSAWTQLGTSLVSPFLSDNFGNIISISGNGNKIAVGASASVVGSEKGRVQVFSWSGTAWLMNGDTLKGDSAFDSFGSSVSLSHDGDLLLTGAPAAYGSASFSGYARLYNYTTLLCTTTTSSIAVVRCGGTYITPSGRYSFTSGGIYNDTIVNSGGCDSIITINLTVNPIFSVNNPRTICQGQVYSFNSKNYTTAGTYRDTLLSVNNCDSIIVTQLTVNPIYSVNNPRTICQGQTYSFNSKNYTTAGTYRDTLRSVNNCDSIIVTQLTVNPSYSVNNPRTICQGQTYSFNSKNYTTAGTYRDTLLSVNNCDSIIVTQLTVNPSYSVNNPRTICQGQTYSFNSKNYTTAGTYRDTLLSVNNCDSIIVTQLTVNPIYSVNNPRTICQGQTYSFNSKNYTTAGTYRDTLRSVNNCDSIIVTQLTVNPIYSVNNPRTICQGQTYSFNSKNYTTAGTYRDTLRSVNNCDSIIVTQLTVNPSYSVNNPRTICQGQTYSFNSKNYTTAGTYRDTLLSVNNCDSIIVTQLTVNPLYSVNNPRTICQGQTYSFNSKNYTTAGTYRDTLRSVNNCDSIILTQLTVNPIPAVNLGNDSVLCSSQGALTLNAANSGSSYLWSTNETVQTISVNTSGNYFVRVTNNGCSAYDTIIVTYKTINKTVTMSGNVFVAADSTATYQWLDCANNKQPIAGATNRSIAALGCIGNTFNYAVKITKDGCIDTSTCQQTALNWSQIGLDINGEAASDQSGWSVSLSANGQVMAIGASSNDGNGINSGHARVYAWSGTAWVQRGIDIDGEAAGDLSGYSVSLSANGDVLAIGATLNDGNGSDAGHVRVYSWSGSAWVQRGIDINGEASSDQSGYSVSLSANGDVLAIGAYLNNGTGSDAGHVRVYSWNGSAWVQRGADIDGEAANDLSGCSISLSANGDVLAIGALGNDGNGINSGHVRVYSWSGGVWVQRGADINGEAASDESGLSVYLSANGDVLAIGATLNNGNGSVDAGHVRVCSWSGSAWVQRGADIDGEAANDLSGCSISLSANGDVLAIGARFNSGNGNNSGHVRVYSWSGSAWVQRGVDIDGEAANDVSGCSISLSANGDVLAIGAIGNDGNGSAAGHVRVYKECNTDPVVVNLGSDTTLCGVSNLLLDAGNAGSTYLWSTGATSQTIAVNASGSYFVKVTKGALIAYDTIIVTYKTINKTVTMSGNVFVAADSTATYQWLDCANNKQPIAGATNRSIATLGCIGNTFNYAVKITKDGCIDTSTCQQTALNWSQIGLDINGEAASDESGFSVSLSANGQVMAIGASSNDGNGINSGHVRVYAWSGTAWLQRGADINGEAAGDNSGYSVSLSANGDVLAIGATLNDGNGSDAGHVRVYSWSGSAWVQRGIDINGEASSDQSGYSVSLSANGDVLAIGATINNGNGANSGHVRVYSWIGSAWVQRGIDIDGEAAGDRSGFSVSLSANGDVLAIGALGNDGNGINSGHVRVYSWSGGVWVQRGSDINGEAASDESGYSVSLSANGDVLAIGAHFNDGNGINSGHVRVYSWSGSVWVQRGADIDGEAASDESGYSVSLSANGDVLAIGAIGNDGNGANSGHARVYSWSGSVWVQRGVDINGEAVADFSGGSVSLSADGDVLAIGATLNDGNGSAAGHVRVYKGCNTDPVVVNLGSDTTLCGVSNLLLDAGNAGSTYLWSTGATSQTIAVNAPGTYFVKVTKGALIAYDTIVVTYRTINKTVTMSGNVFVAADSTATYQWLDCANNKQPIAGATNRSIAALGCIGNTFNYAVKITKDGCIDTSTCQQITLNSSQIGLDINGEAVEDQSGWSVSLSANGQVMAIGAPSNDGNGSSSGQVRVYSWSGSNWVQRGADIDGEAVGDQSGFSVSLSANGDILAIGARNNDGNGDSSGHVRVYSWSGSVWVQRGANINGEAVADFSGYSVSLSANGDVLAIGATINNGNGANSGHVRVYSWSGSAWVQRGADIDGEAAGDRSGWSVSLSANGDVLAIGGIDNDGNGNSSGHVRVYNWNGSAWVQRGSDINGEAASDESGYSVSLSANGQVMAIGAPSNAGNGFSSGHVRVYSWSGSAWVQRGADINGEAALDQSGWSVSLSANGDVLAVGAFRNDGNGSADAGHARIYRWSGSAWVQRGTDIDGEAAEDYSGFSVSLSADGDVLAIGAVHNDGNGSAAGHVRVYKTCNNDPVVVNLGSDTTLCGVSNLLLDAGNAGSTYLWSTGATSQTITVNASGTYFVKVTKGALIAYDTIIVTYKTINKTVTMNGNVFLAADSTATYQWLDCANNKQPIAGATNRSIVTLGCIGNTFNYAVKITKDGCIDTSTCQQTALNWSQIGLDINGEASSDRSGYSVSLSANGQVMAIGAVDNDGSGSVWSGGHVRVYSWSGSAWVQRGADIDGEAQEIKSGWSVSLSANGNVLAIGAPGAAGGGRVRVYSWSGSAWVQRGAVINGEAPGDQSGWSVSLSANGDVLAIGAPFNDGNGNAAGHVRVYAWSGTAWVQRGADIDGEASSDRSGYSVSLSANGDVLAIGAEGNDGNGNNAGHVRVYSWSGSAWVQRGSDRNGEAAEDESGRSVSLSANGDVLAIGAHRNDGNGNDAGHVRVYSWSGGVWVQRGSDINGEDSVDFSGYSVSLSSNGDVLAIGAIKNNNSSGHVRVFSWSGGVWVQRGADINGEAASDESGYSVSLSANGDVLAIGAIGNDGNGFSSGHVRVYRGCNANLVVVNNPQTICQGQAYVINAKSYTISGTYRDTLRAINNNDSIIVMVTELIVNPSYSVSNPRTICQGQVYSFNSKNYTTAGTYRDTLRSVNNCDSIIVTQLTVNPSYSVNNPRTICQGQSYSINSKSYTMAGTYRDTLRSINNCDSIIVTQLTVNPSYSVNNPRTICQGQSYSINSKSYTVAGTYRDTLRSVDNCDSIIVTQLTVNPSYSENNPRTICQGQVYSFNSKSYTMAGTYRDTLRSINNCDSIIVTQLTVNPSYSVNNPRTICQGQVYSFNSKNYTVAGTYRDTLRSVTNCDSIIVTQLTVNPIYSVNNPRTICQGQSYSFNSKNYTVAGTYRDTLRSVTNCDSIIVTQLTVNPTYSVSNPRTICQGQVYSFNSKNYTVAGTYRDTLRSVTNCDSIIVTQLTVNPSYSVNNPRTICQGQVYSFNSKNYTVAGMYRDTLRSATNCDSIIVTQLTVNPTYSVSNPRTICQGQVYSFNSKNYTMAGTYRDTLRSVTNCDSIIVTQLTVNPTYSVNNPRTICQGQVYSFNSKNYTVAGMYRDTLRSVTNCDSIIVTQLTVNPTYSVSNPRTICQGQVYSFNSKNYTMAGTYRDTLRSVTNCDSIIVTQLTVNPKPLTSAISGNATPAPSSTEVYSVVNTVGSSYQWFITNGIPLTGSSSSSISVIWSSIITTSSVRVLETNIAGCRGDTISRSVVLPVELISFDAIKIDETVHLKWITANELNNSHFIVERSLDGIQFEAQGTVKGNGTSNAIHSYSFIDDIRNIKADYIYYRLKQVDFDGKYAYSTVAKIDNEESTVHSLFVTAQPNPFVDELQINIQSSEGEQAHISIFDIAGKELMQQSVVLVQPSTKVNIINGSELADGFYYIKVTINEESKIIKVIKKREG